MAKSKKGNNQTNQSNIKSGFKKSEFYTKSFNEKFNFLKKKILQIAPWAEVRAIGGTAIPRALTKGDVDLLVRLEKNQFLKTIKLLKKSFKENNLELWENHFAIFKDDFSFDEKIDILVTAIGSKSDLRHQATELLRKDQLLLREYNQMKTKITDFDSDEYKIKKSKFYDRLEKILIRKNKKV